MEHKRSLLTGGLAALPVQSEDTRAPYNGRKIKSPIGKLARSRQTLHLSAVEDDSGEDIAHEAYAEAILAEARHTAKKRGAHLRKIR
jgi:hypothetical protein